ncbi:MAG: DUF460 domain-containing protein [Candidatus Micrarchaeota archaeon]|nr:DUF460 domain-containing protein [Candidatus Micrarchaeota archaeon]
MLMKHTIIGIDSGKTAAVVSIDLDGNVVGIDTGRFVGLEWFVDRIREKGTPVVIASDKRNAQSLVHRLAAIFGSSIFTPDADVSVDRKQQIAHGRELENLHERDALAAAMIAYNSYANKLKQAEKIAKERHVQDVDRIKALVIKRHSVDEAITDRKSNRF